MGIVVDNMKIEKLHQIMELQRELGYVITLRQALKQFFPQFHAHDPEHQLEAFMHEYGLNFDRSTVSNLFTMKDDIEKKWLWMETLLSALTIAINEDTSYKDLIAYSTFPQSSSVKQPYIDTTKISPVIKAGKEVPMGGTFESETITVGEKNQNFNKFGKRLQIPYETIADCTLKVLSYFLRGYASIVNLDKKDYIFNILLNGDQAINSKKVLISDPVTTIGVQDTTKKLQWIDILFASMRMSRLGRKANIMSSGELEAITTLNLDEYKMRYQGTSYAQMTIKGDVSTPDTCYVSESIGENKTLLYSSQYGVSEHVRQATMIESDNIISTQVIDFVVSERIAYMIQFSDCRVLIDWTKAYSSNKFPDSWNIRKAA